jgi:beta-glucanase (GH16 family)
MKRFYVIILLGTLFTLIVNGQNFSKFDVSDNKGVKGLNGLAHRTGAKTIDILVPENFNTSNVTVDFEFDGGGILAESMPIDFTAPQIVKVKKDPAAAVTEWTVTFRSVKPDSLPLQIDFSDDKFTPADWNGSTKGWAWASIDTAQKKVVRFGNLTATLIATFNEPAENVTYTIASVGNNEFGNGLFHVYASANGEDWTVLRTFDNSQPLTSERASYTEELSEDIRYVKWVYTTRTINVNIYSFSVMPKEVVVIPEPEDPYKPDFNPPHEREGMTLVWNDEFNNTGKPNPANWYYENGFVRNEELQWYQSSNVSCKGGVLLIEAKREQVKNPNYVEGSTDWKKNREYAEYTSGSISTQRLKDFKYGRYEIRARIDTTLGSWPAIWGKGITGSWPYCGEIDIMEFYRKSKDPKRPIILANLAWGSTNPNVGTWNTGSFPFDDITQNDTEWDKKFHVWRMDWTPESVKLYLDDRLLNSQDLSKAINPAGSTPMEPFQQNFYFMLNLAVGSNGGNPANSTFPIIYEVDYIRVYQTTEGSSNKEISVDYKTIFSPNPVKDVLNIQNDAGIKSLTIYDSLGKSVFSIDSPQNSINLSNLNEGLYLLQFINNDGTKGFRKILKSTN